MFVRGREYEFDLVGAKALRRPNLYWFAFSGLLIVAALVSLFAVGLNLGLEFKGGLLLKLQLERPADVGQVRGMLAQYADLGLDKSIVQTGETEDGLPTLILRMPYIEERQSREDTLAAIRQSVEETYGIDESKGNQGVLQEEQVGSEWGREVSQKALIGLGVFLVVILIYITLRLEFKMAVAAIAALVHDTIITVGIYALSGRQVTPVTVIAFLTILGYSLYDTIVVFDRVEENVNLQSRAGKSAYSDIVNASVNQTLMRSIGTTLTTLLPIITILIFGGETLKDFAFALFLGVFLGAYSSIFIASPILAMWKEREPRYAAVREKAEIRGAREAILISSSGPAQVAAAKKGGGKEPAAAEEEEEAPRAEPAAAKPAAKPKPKPAAAPAKAASGPASTPKKKAATTRGPSAGKKKKKKKKK